MPPAAPASTSSQALGNLQSFEGGMQSGADIYKQQSQNLGVDAAGQQVSGLRQAITNTTNLLNQVAPSVYGRTENSLVTDAQATKQIGNEQAPISANLNKENTDLTNSQANYQNLLGQAATLSNLQDQSQQEKLTGLQGIYQALYGQEKDSAAAAEAKRQFDVSQTQNQSQFNANLGAASRSGGSSGGTAKAPTSAQSMQADAAGAFGYLDARKGVDNHVNPVDWNTALQKWLSAGYTTQDFLKRFQQYVNSNDKSAHYTGFNGYVKG